MFGNTLDAKDLNAELGTENGALIVDALRPFREAPLTLKPATPHLAADLAAALRDLGIPHRNTLALSMGDLLRYVATLPEPLRIYACAGFQNGIGERALTRSRHLRSELFDSPSLPATAVACGRQSSHANEIVGDVTRPHHEQLSRQYPEIFNPSWEAMPFGLFACLVRQVDCLLVGETDVASKFGRIAKFFLDGNFPVGRTIFDDHVVLVA